MGERAIVKELLQLFLPLIVGWIGDEVLEQLKFSSKLKTIFFVIVGVWFVIAFLLFIRNQLVSLRDRKQKEFNVSTVGIYYDDRMVHEETISKEIKGFKWKIQISRPRGKFEEKHIKLEGIYGPFCPKDECEMNEERTYFGRYRFICPYCNYKDKSSKSGITLSDDVKKIINMSKE